MIKFICKDLFLHVYGKQIDNLRTNHRVSGGSPEPPVATRGVYFRLATL
jgi:hypothetical protein